MSVENLNNILSPWSKTDLCTCNTLTHIPVSSPKGGRSPIKRVLEHGTLLNGPAAQDSQATTESAAVVELAIGKNLTGMVTNGFVVLLSETFLQ
jgi:hypothetical protein